MTAEQPLLVQCGASADGQRGAARDRRTQVAQLLERRPHERVLLQRRAEVGGRLCLAPRQARDTAQQEQPRRAAGHLCRTAGCQPLSLRQQNARAMCPVTDTVHLRSCSIET